MSKEEVIILSVLILQSVSMCLSLRRLIKSRCTASLDIERNIQVQKDDTPVDSSLLNKNG
jgi:hypothetical protein